MKVPIHPVKRWLLALGFGLAASATAHAQTAPIWAEEFDGERINTDIWQFTTGDSGYGNGELQYYTASSNNAYIEDGQLVIEARREDYSGRQFTSARLNTNGRLSFRYGTLEARIKLPEVGNGLWPAFWMMGTNFGIDGWPRSGEWDILEAGSAEAQADGTVNQNISAAMHWWHESGDWSDNLHASHSESTLVAPNFHDDFHTYKLEWTPTEVIVSVDDNAFFSLDITDPNLSELRDNPAFIILNMAVGGWNYVDITDPAQITAAFPARMVVDYVRLYENQYTELFIASEDRYSGNFGVMTETTPVSAELDWGDNTNLYVWNNMTPVPTTPSEGGTALGYEIGADDWWGVGLLHKDHNMANYTHGYLHVDVNTTATIPISIGIGSTMSEGASVELVAGGEQYGLVRDGQWHTVSIPLSQFGNVDFDTINAFFTASGPGPAAAVEIAFDNIYWSESIVLPAPEFGSFGIYTETPAHMDAGNFGFGVEGDLYLWDNTLELTSGSALEGNSALHLQSTGQGWYGLGLTARTGFNLTAFDNPGAALHFSMRTTDQGDFQIGIKSGNLDDVGQKWINFSAGNDPYGFARDGQWHTIVIPVSDIASDVDLFDVRQVFQLLGTGEISDFSIDDIYLSGGTEAKDPGTGGPSVNRPPTAAINPSVIAGPTALQVTFDGSQSGDVNGDELTYAWDFGDGHSATGVNVDHVYTEQGIYTATLTVSDGEFDTSVQRIITVNDNYTQRISDKRGLGYGNHSVADLAAISQGISWWYNWHHMPDLMIQDVYQDYGVNFVPMAWNGGFDDQGMRDYLAANPEVEYILAFNEPNFIEQANMTPSQAAAEWYRLEAIAAEFDVKIGSVAMNFCGHCVTENGTTYYDPIEYFDDFFAACSNCQVDAIIVHAYMEDVGGIEWYIDLFKKYNRPIWLKEFSAWEDTTTLEEQKRFLIHTVDYLENDPDVERYAWFTGRRDGHPYNGLFDYRQSGILTELGDIYINMPVHGDDVVHSVPGLIEAQNYAHMSGIRLELTEDTSGFLNVSEVAAGDWVEYNLTGAAGSFELDARVASAVGGSISVLVNGAQVATLDVSATGGLQSWLTVSTALALEEGAKTLRLVFNQPTSLNWLRIGGDDDQSPPLPSTDNLALNRPAFASSAEGHYSAAAAVDNNPDTRWASDWSDHQWIYVDLGEVHNISEVVLNWEAAYGQSYEIQVSDDAVSWTTLYITTEGAGGVEVITLSGSGRYVRLLGTERGTPWGYSLWEFEIYGDNTPPVSPPPTGNLALNQPVSASSIESPVFSAAAAVDGDTGSRWASDWSDLQWISVDLGSVQTISRVVLNWEAAYGKSYEIQISNNGSSWTSIYTTTSGEGGVEDLAVSGTGRYVRLLAAERATSYGYSLWEFEVY